MAVVSTSLALALAPNASALVGRSLDLGGSASSAPIVVVGVVGDVSLGNARQADPRILYRSGVQAGEGTMSTMHLRIAGDRRNISTAVADVVQSFGHERVIGPYELDRLFANGLVAERIGALVGGLMAALAICICCLGLYVLLAQSVAARTKKIAIRIAVGAAPARVWRRIVAQGVMLVLCGLAVGYPAALAAASRVHVLLFGVSPTDVMSYVVCIAVLLLCGLLAAGVPAWRATRIDPSLSLRSM